MLQETIEKILLFKITINWGINAIFIIKWNRNFLVLFGAKGTGSDLFLKGHMSWSVHAKFGIIMQKFCPTKKWIRTPFEIVNYLVIFIKEFTELNIFCHFS